MKPTKPVSRLSFCLIALIATIISLISLSLFLSRYPLPSLSHFIPCHCSVPPAHAAPASVRTTFESISLLEDLNSEADAAWDALSTPEGGFLRVQYNETYVQSWGIAMFHQLHCLGLIRRMLQKQMGLAASGRHHHGEGKAAQHQDDPEHVTHCFAYLAQALQCSGDGTIEPPWVAHDRAGYIKVDGVDGLGVVHQCRSTKHLWSAARESERKAVDIWDWKEGDEVGDIFGIEGA